MTLEALQAAMFAAMKSKDKVRKNAISSLIDAVKKAAIDKRCKDNIPETLVDKTILKEQSIVNEMIAKCPDSRPELLAEYTARLKVINEFAPSLITDENEIRKMVFSLLAITDIQQDGKGAVMKAIMPQLKDKVDMKLANKVLSEILSKSQEV